MQSLLSVIISGYDFGFFFSFNFEINPKNYLGRITRIFPTNYTKHLPLAQGIKPGQLPRPNRFASLQNHFWKFRSFEFWKLYSSHTNAINGFTEYFSGYCDCSYRKSSSLVFKTCGKKEKIESFVIYIHRQLPLFFNVPSSISHRRPKFEAKESLPRSWQIMIHGALVKIKIFGCIRDS